MRRTAHREDQQQFATTTKVTAPVSFGTPLWPPVHDSILVLLQQLRWCLLLLLLLLLLGYCVPTSRYFSSNLDWARNLLFFLVQLYPIINETNVRSVKKSFVIID